MMSATETEEVVVLERPQSPPWEDIVSDAHASHRRHYKILIYFIHLFACIFSEA